MGRESAWGSLNLNHQVAGSQVSANDAKTLQGLLAEVNRTRSRVVQLEREAQAGTARQTLPAARRATLQALENYTAALQRLGWPIPPKMAGEIKLLRVLCGIRRPRHDT